jgi:hypothetical protein
MTGSVLVFWCRAMLRCEMCAWQYGERRNAWFARRGAKIYARLQAGSRSDSQRGHWRQNLCSAMQGQPKCLLRNARAGTTSPRKCTFIRRKHASTQRTQAFTGRRHPHPPGGVAYATKSADRQPAVAGNTDAVPRESSIVRRPTTHDRRAAGVSPPWVVGRV